MIVTARCIGSIANAQSEVGTITPLPDKLSASGLIFIHGVPVIASQLRSLAERVGIF